MTGPRRGFEYSSHGTTTRDDDDPWAAALCRYEDPELFFADHPRDIMEAKRICMQCPLRYECLTGARERREPWGVWGGELFAAGVTITPKRQPGPAIKQGNLATANAERRAQGEQARAEVVATVEDLVRIGADIERAAQATGRKTAALARYLQRAQRHDLLAQLKRTA